MEKEYKNNVSFPNPEDDYKNLREEEEYADALYEKQHPEED